MKEFGLSRVKEPKGALPVTAWKVNNQPKLSGKELRIRLEYICLERDSLCQMCSISGRDEKAIKEKILRIVSERGKLHNPYTESGALFTGVVEEISDDYKDCSLKPGDKVISMSTMAGLPAYIRSIESLDYTYGLLKCTGYVICFEATVLKQFDTDDERSRKYMLRALEEEGNFYGILDIIKNLRMETAVIIGNSLVETVLYACLLRKSNPNISISCLVESGCACAAEDYGGQIIKTLNGLVKNIYIDNIVNPVETAETILKGENNGLVDGVICLENIKGCESVAALIVREGGIICHTNMSNNYSQGLLIGDSLGKEIITYALDGLYGNTFEFAKELVKTAELYLDRLDSYIKKTGKDKKTAAKIMPEKLKQAARQIDGFTFVSPVTENMVEEALNVAKYDCNVVIQGETGVGKERVFDLIQQNSPRRSKPCIKINCATIQESLAESEFFGYEKGAFTGANSSGKKGYFELANNGTLFLDEVGSLSLVMQSKLLRVLQENTFYRVGGTVPAHVNVRVICANNIPLKKLVEEGKFREDLFYRLNICLIDVPPLRERPEDILYLADTFLKGYSKKYGLTKEMDAEAFQKLEEYHWPGNVRELENTIHRLYIGQRGTLITAESVDDLLNQTVFEESIIDIKKEFRRDDSMNFNEILEQQEKKLIQYALKKEGTTRKAAEFLKIPQATLSRKKIKYNL